MRLAKRGCSTGGEDWGLALNSQYHHTIYAVVIFSKHENLSSSAIRSLTCSSFFGSLPCASFVRSPQYKARVYHRFYRGFSQLPANDVFFCVTPSLLCSLPKPFQFSPSSSLSRLESTFFTPRYSLKNINEY